MPRIPRKLLIDLAEVGVYHCISRCVRRAFLCGTDPLSGRSFDHRKQWIQDRLQFLAGQFGVDVLGFSLMSNHLHLILRNRPDVVAGWSDDEVARRWWNVFPSRTERDGQPSPPQESDLLMVTGNAARLQEVRERLSSVSWFMRCVAEPIARRANREDQCTGRFWEGRYKCQPILDESALAACLAYVDLNPIRAGIALTPETSRFTSVFERIEALRFLTTPSAAASQSFDPRSLKPVPPESVPPGTAQSELDQTAMLSADRGQEAECAGTAQSAPPMDSRSDGVVLDDSASGSSPHVATMPLRRDAWLSPFSLTPTTGLTPSGTEPPPTARASNAGCLEMSFEDYLQLLDWTGRELRRDKRGAIPAELAPILNRLQVSEEGWLKLVTRFSRLFRRAAGTPTSIDREAQKHGRRREGIRISHSVFL